MPVIPAIGGRDQENFGLVPAQGKKVLGLHLNQWLSMVVAPVIPATWEAQIGGWWSTSAQAKSETLSQNQPMQEDWRCASRGGVPA
jgi:hypothetical protein